jgi:ribosomal protein S18 acetylase RimI-like enzyme
VDLMARGFGMPKEVVQIFGAQGFLSHPAINVLVGLLGDDWVTTGLSMTTGTFVGIYNVAVVPEHRRKGFGSAATLRALAAGAAAGGTSAYLQASDEGYGVYERLGFVESERWKLFVSGS